MKRLVIAASVALLPIVAVTSAEAKTRFSVEYLFDEWAPHPQAYFFDEEYDDPYSDDVVVYDRAPRDSLNDYNEDYYQPEYQPQKRRLTKRPANSDKPTIVKARRAEPKLASVPKQQPAQVTTSDKTKPTSISCSKAAGIVSGYGFSEVKVKSCDGKVYAFTGARAGKTYEINLSSASGQLTEVKRL